MGRLEGHFLDRLRGMETLRIFGRVKLKRKTFARVAGFRQRTMKCYVWRFCRLAYWNSFTPLSIALVAVYFGFSYLGALDFGHGTAG
ncbi:hypothetical protein KIF59_19690 [Enterobacter cloacae subsp. cloacae]|nr:hypothetical protein [Enterobacter cloacae subsp. cloacae]